MNSRIKDGQLLVESLLPVQPVRRLQTLALKVRKAA